MAEKLVLQVAQKSKLAAQKLAIASTFDKNKALLSMADCLTKEMDFILKENEKDMDAARKAGMRKSFLDRLLLTKERILDMATGLRQVAQLQDPVGQVIAGYQAQNGLEICKTRVPLGVIAIIYEARPNVTADAAGLCLKSGNAVILRGGSEAFNSNKAISSILSSACEKAGLSADCIQFISTTDRVAVDVMLRLNDYIDVIIPRGGAELIKKVVQNSSVPVIETGVGICHVFVDKSADFDMARKIAYNAKVSRPSVCNAMETLLVHKEVARAFLPRMIEEFFKADVEIFADSDVCTFDSRIVKAQEENWHTEYGDLKVNIKIVDDIADALNHIAKYGSKHSEAIITNDYEHAKLFQKAVDAAAVYVNTSTRFTDGFEFGLGAEIGISTQKMHARGPMGLVELTSVKFIVNGSGQIRG